MVQIVGAVIPIVCSTSSEYTDLVNDITLGKIPDITSYDLDEPNLTVTLHITADITRG